MTHSDWPAFLTAIVANPDDDTLRLVAADFLEENGEPDRAEFIRVQITLAKLTASRSFDWTVPPDEALELEEDALRRKEGAFLGPKSAFPRVWAMEDCPELVHRPPTHTRSPRAPARGSARVKWHRGFVERIDCAAAEWLRHGAEVRKRNPVRDVILHDCRAPARSDWHASLDALRGLRRVWLDLFPAQSHDEEFVNWLRGCSPETEVIGAPF